MRHVVVEHAVAGTGGSPRPARRRCRGRAGAAAARCRPASRRAAGACARSRRRCQAEEDDAGPAPGRRGDDRQQRAGARSQAAPSNSGRGAARSPAPPARSSATARICASTARGSGRCAMPSIVGVAPAAAQRETGRHAHCYTFTMVTSSSLRHQVARTGEPGPGAAARAQAAADRRRRSRSPRAPAEPAVRDLPLRAPIDLAALRPVG